jgi:ferredoxin
VTGQVEVLLDTKLCMAYGVCVTIMPDVFDTPAGSPVAVLLRERIEAHERDELDEAVRSCPSQALAVREPPS